MPKMIVPYKRSASITFRGFALSREVVQLLVGVEAKLFALRDTPMRPTRPNLWQRSVAKFEVEFADHFPIVDMLPTQEEQRTCAWFGIKYYRNF